LEIDSFLQPVEDPLISRFQTELKENTAGSPQSQAKIGVRKMVCKSGKPIPGCAQRSVGQSLQDRRGDGVIQEVDECGPFLSDERVYIQEYSIDGNGPIGILLLSLGTEGTLIPVTSGGGIVGENGSGSKVFSPGQSVVIRRGLEFLLRFRKTEEAE
jgi:hypothetical protein